MTIKQKIACFLMMTLCAFSLSSAVKAAAPATLTLTHTTGDGVQIQVTGDPSATIQFSFLPPGASAVTTTSFGSTDANGNFNTTISSGGYGIPQGSPTYITINGMQSATTLWPVYASSLAFTQNGNTISNIQVALGQSVTLGGSSALIMSANSNSASIGTAVSGSQLTITGLANGSGTLWLCGSNVGCNSLAVTVGGQGQSQMTLSTNTIVLSNNQSKSVYIFGGSNNGYTIKSNSNPTVVDASISGTSNEISLFGTHTAGVATIIACSVESANNCATLNVTVTSGTSNTLSFNQNNLSLIPGLTQTVSVAGGPDNNYFISSNTNSGAASATMSGSNITVTGGSNTGATAITVCSTSVNATCGTLNVSLVANSNTPSANVIAFSQNVVNVPNGGTSTVTVSGGTGSGYVVSSNSNAAIGTASINGASNIITLSGLTTGSTIITVCSASIGTTCASLYVNVGPQLIPIAFSQNNITLNDNQKIIISITGGTGTANDNVITTNTNPSAVTTYLNSNGNILMVSAGSVSGSAVITVCSTLYPTNCGSLNVATSLLIAPTPSPTPVVVAPPVAPLTPAVQGVKVTPAYKFTKFLNVGSSGTEVRELQKILQTAGFLKVAPTGYYGAATRAAVKLYQKQYNISQLGYVGPGTRAQLNKAQ